MHQPHSLTPELEAKVEGKVMHPALGAVVCVLERPLDGQLSDLAVVRVSVGAAAIMEVPADRIVVVAVDRRDLPVFDQRADSVRMRPVAD
jgi:hypothetical protein